jgi:hypothetical protein
MGDFSIDFTTPFAGVDSVLWVGNSVFLESPTPGPEGDPNSEVGNFFYLAASLPLAIIFPAALTSYGFFFWVEKIPYSAESSFKIDRLLRSSSFEE